MFLDSAPVKEDKCMRNKEEEEEEEDGNGTRQQPRERIVVESGTSGRTRSEIGETGRNVARRIRPEVGSPGTMRGA